MEKIPSTKKKHLKLPKLSNLEKLPPLSSISSPVSCVTQASVVTSNTDSPIIAPDAVKYEEKDLIQFGSDEKKSPIGVIAAETVQKSPVRMIPPGLNLESKPIEISITTELKKEIIDKISSPQKMPSYPATPTNIKLAIPQMSKIKLVPIATEVKQNAFVPKSPEIEKEEVPPPSNNYTYPPNYQMPYGYYPYPYMHPGMYPPMHPGMYPPMYPPMHSPNNASYPQRPENFYSIPVQPEVPKPQPVEKEEISEDKKVKDEAFRNQFKIPKSKYDFSKISPDDEYHLRLIYKEKYEILANSYKTWKIDIPDAMWSLEKIERTYEFYLKKIIIRNKTVKYKACMVVICFATIYAGKRYGINMEGYVQSQMEVYNEYIKLFDRLGEEEYLDDSSEWPIWMQLLFVYAVSSFGFVAAKMGKDFGFSEKDVKDFVKSMIKSEDTMSTCDSRSYGIPDIPESSDFGGLGSFANFFEGDGISKIFSMFTDKGRKKEASFKPKPTYSE